MARTAQNLILVTLSLALFSSSSYAATDAKKSNSATPELSALDLSANAPTGPQLNIEQILNRRRTQTTLVLYATVLTEILNNGEKEVDGWVAKLTRKFGDKTDPREIFEKRQKCLSNLVVEWHRVSETGNFASTREIRSELLKQPYADCRTIVGDESQANVHGAFLEALMQAEERSFIYDQKLAHLNALQILTMRSGDQYPRAAQDIAFFYMDDVDGRIVEKAKEVVRNLPTIQKVRNALDFVRPDFLIAPATGTVSGARLLGRLASLTSGTINTTKMAAAIASIAIHIGVAKKVVEITGTPKDAPEEYQKWALSSGGLPSNRFKNRENLEQWLPSMQIDPLPKSQMIWQAMRARQRYLKFGGEEFDFLPLFVFAQSNADKLNPVQSERLLREMLSLSAAIRIALEDKSKTFIQRIDVARKLVYQHGIIRRYVKIQPYLLPMIESHGGNCVAQTQLFIALFYPHRDLLEKGWQLTFETLPYHIQPALLNIDAGVSIDLVSGSASSKIEHGFFHPAAYIEGFLRVAREVKDPKKLTPWKYFLLASTPELGFRQLLSQLYRRDTRAIENKYIELPPPIDASLVGDGDLGEPPKIPDEAVMDFKEIHKKTGTESSDGTSENGKGKKKGSETIPGLTKEESEKLFPQGLEIPKSLLAKMAEALSPLSAKAKKHANGTDRAGMLPGANGGNASGQGFGDGQGSSGYSSPWPETILNLEKSGFSPPGVPVDMKAKKYMSPRDLVVNEIRTAAVQMRDENWSEFDLINRYASGTAEAPVLEGYFLRFRNDNERDEAEKAPSNRVRGEVLEKILLREISMCRARTETLLKVLKSPTIGQYGDGEIYSLQVDTIVSKTFCIPKLYTQLVAVETFKSDRPFRFEYFYGEQQFQKVYAEDLERLEIAAMSIPALRDLMALQVKLVHVIAEKPEALAKIIAAPTTEAHNRLVLRQLVTSESLSGQNYRPSKESKPTLQSLDDLERSSALFRYVRELERPKTALISALSDPQRIGITEKVNNVEPEVPSLPLPLGENPIFKFSERPNLKKSSQAKPCPANDPAGRCQEQTIVFLNREKASVYLPSRVYLELFFNLLPDGSYQGNGSPFTEHERKIQQNRLMARWDATLENAFIDNLRSEKRLMNSAAVKYSDPYPGFWYSTSLWNTLKALQPAWKTWPSEKIVTVVIEESTYDSRFPAPIIKKINLLATPKFAAVQACENKLSGEADALRAKLPHSNLPPEKQPRVNFQPLYKKLVECLDQISTNEL